MPIAVTIERNAFLAQQRNETLTHVWFWKSRLPERKGKLCKILARGRMNSILVEFEDGCKVVTSRYAVRRIQAARAKNTAGTQKSG